MTKKNILFIGSGLVDIQLQKNHGVFISQESPITYKDNFQIDII